MLKRIFLMVVWLGFVAYAVFFSPPDHPETLALIVKLSSGQWTNLNPLIVALFNLMGLWPMIYACLLLVDGAGQKVLAWPFVVGSFGLGAFALLPYLFLRNPNPDFVGPPNRLLAGLESRWVGWGVAIATFILLIYGFTTGDVGDFLQQWQTSKFIHVMSLDFCLLSLLIPTLLGDDMARRGWGQRPGIFWAVTLLPMLGPALYLALRPPLPETIGMAPSVSSAS